MTIYRKKNKKIESFKNGHGGKTFVKLAFNEKKLIFQINTALTTKDGEIHIFVVIMNEFHFRRLFEIKLHNYFSFFISSQRNSELVLVIERQRPC